MVKTEHTIAKLRLNLNLKSSFRTAYDSEGLLALWKKIFNIIIIVFGNCQVNKLTRPGVDKVKPKGWIKYSLQLD